MVDLKEVRSLLEATTLDELMRYTQSFQGGVNIKNAGYVSLRNVRVAIDTKEKILQLEAESETGSRCIIQMFDVNAFHGPSENANKAVETTEGKVAYMTKQSFEHTDVKVRCSCPSFQFTGMWWIHKLLKGLIGEPIPYTPKSDRPSRNPQEIPVICKHLVALIGVMRENGYI